MITKPTLPPKQGYVEDLDESGNHYYKPTPETEERLELESANAQNTTQLEATQSVLDALLMGNITI